MKTFKKKIVTLYVDDTNIRLLVIHGKQIKKCAELPLDLGTASIKDDIKEAEIAAKTRQLLKSQKVRTKKVIVGLSGRHCLSRPIILPILPKAMLNEAVMREARRVLPIPLEQLYVSWQTIPAPEGKSRVFLTAVPRQIADSLNKILRQVGLKPYLMGVKPLALTRLVKEATAIIVDVQPTEFDLVIMADGVPQPIRTISFPDETLTPQDKLRMVKDDLSRTIEFYNSNNPEKPLTSDTPIFVSGELAEEPQLLKTLSGEFGYPTLPLSSPLKCSKQLDLAHYMANVGLALKELLKESGPVAVNINSLPTPYLPKPIPWVRIATVPVTAIIVGLLSLMTTNIQEASVNIASIRSQLDNANHIINQKQLQKKELTGSIAALENKIAAAKASHNTFSAAIDVLETQGGIINGDLAETISSLLGPVSLTRISHAGNRLTIAGGAPSEVEVLAYARNLDNSGRFSEVTISSIRRVDAEDDEAEDSMNFILTLKTGEQD